MIPGEKKKKKKVKEVSRVVYHEVKWNEKKKEDKIEQEAFS